jgi:hypothetical protein
VLRSCAACETTEEGECEQCGVRRHEWFGDDALTDFCKWLFTEENRDAVVLAHNFRAYDGNFILDYIHQQGRRPTIITRGLDIMACTYDSLKFLDTLSFLPMGLAAMPKAFGFEEQKGFVFSMSNLYLSAGISRTCSIDR